jgi:hypothetical protein
MGADNVLILVLPSMARLCYGDELEAQSTVVARFFAVHIWHVAVCLDYLTYSLSCELIRLDPDSNSALCAIVILYPSVRR